MCFETWIDTKLLPTNKLKLLLERLIVFKLLLIWVGCQVKLKVDLVAGQQPSGKILPFIIHYMQ